MLTKALPFFLLLASCGGATNWRLASIEAKDPRFDSSRLVYYPKDPISGLSLELIYTKEGTSAYLVSPIRRFKQGDRAHIQFSEKSIDIELALHEGRMKARLPEEIADLCVLALKEGQDIDIIVGSLEQKILAERFSSMYEQFLKGTSPLLDIFKGPL